MKALYLHAHYDDYEFTASGTFEMWRRQLGDRFRAKVVVCTDGAAGHHFRTRAETARLRLAEQLESARLGRYAFELLRLRDGTTPREACLQLTPDFLAALWKTIRDFEPDYLFCPPLPADPLAGVHADHLVVAQAVRQVAYMINVPHAFTPEYPADESRSEPKRTPVIIATYDGYMFGGNTHDVAIDVEPAFEDIVAMTWCHGSQIQEWLPWVGRHQMDVPQNRDEWRLTLRRRFDRKNRELGIRSAHALEVFTVTAWGEIPTLDQLRADLPALAADASPFHALNDRLRRWRGAEA